MNSFPPNVTLGEYREIYLNPKKLSASTIWGLHLVVLQSQIFKNMYVRAMHNISM